MPPAQWYTGIVIQIQDLAPNTRSFTIQIPEVTVFPFIAGQFITFDLPVGEKRLQRWRSYSIASPPRDSNLIELCLVHLDRGLGSTYFFEQVVIGTELKFKKPEGGFVLPDIIDHDLVMICTGTGIAPFRSMIQDIIHHKVNHQNIHLIFGTRHREDILYLDEWHALARDYDWFKFDIALSREIINNDDPYPWSNAIKIHKGYVHPIYIDAYADYRSDIHFYLCGWSKMIDEAVANLFVQMKYPRQQIHYELYG